MVQRGKKLFLVFEFDGNRVLFLDEMDESINFDLLMSWKVGLAHHFYYQ